MEVAEVKEAVLAIITDVAMDEDLSELTSDGSLREQLDLDSMDFLDIVMELKVRHKIEVPTEDFGQLATLDGCVEYLAPKFNK